VSTSALSTCVSVSPAVRATTRTNAPSGGAGASASVTQPVSSWSVTALPTPPITRPITVTRSFCGNPGRSRTVLRGFIATNLALGVHALRVAAGARVDLQRLAFVDEQRHRDLETRLHGRGLHRAARRVALEAGLGAQHLEHDEGGR